MTERQHAAKAQDTAAEIINDDLLDDVIGGSNTSLFRLSHPKGAPQAYAPSGD